MFLDGWSWNGWAVVDGEVLWTVLLVAIALLVLLTPTWRRR